MTASGREGFPAERLNREESGLCYVEAACSADELVEEVPSECAWERAWQTVLAPSFRPWTVSGLRHELEEDTSQTRRRGVSPVLLHLELVGLCPPTAGPGLSPTQASPVRVPEGTAASVKLQEARESRERTRHRKTLIGLKLCMKMWGSPGSLCRAVTLGAQAGVALCRGDSRTGCACVLRQEHPQMGGLSSLGAGCPDRNKRVAGAVTYLGALRVSWSRRPQRTDGGRKAGNLMSELESLTSLGLSFLIRRVGASPASGWCWGETVGLSEECSLWVWMCYGQTCGQ